MSEHVRIARPGELVHFQLNNGQFIVAEFSPDELSVRITAGDQLYTSQSPRHLEVTTETAVLTKQRSRGLK